MRSNLLFKDKSNLLELNAFVNRYIKQLKATFALVSTFVVSPFLAHIWRRRIKPGMQARNCPNSAQTGSSENLETRQVSDGSWCVKSGATRRPHFLNDSVLSTLYTPHLYPRVKSGSESALCAGIASSSCEQVMRLFKCKPWKVFLLVA